MRILLRTLVAIALPLGGCTSMAAMQRPVASSDLKLSICPSSDEVREAHSLPFAERGAFRDLVISNCVKAIDRRYQIFKAQLHEESSSSKLATAIIATGTSAIGTFAKADVARRLAAGNAFVLGASGAIDKSVFFDQTLPALEASMDARRDVILTRIIDSQRGDPEGRAYSLVSAGYDLDAYQNAGNLYAAVAQLTQAAAASAQAASKERQDAQINLFTLGQYNRPGPGIAARFDALYAKVRGYKDPNDAAKLDGILANLKIEAGDQWTFEAKRAAVIGAIKRQELVRDQNEQAANAATLEGFVK